MKTTNTTEELLLDIANKDNLSNEIKKILSMGRLIQTKNLIMPQENHALHAHHHKQGLNL
ncbi:hypothetical protein KKJ25_19120 [Xenorhabdus bovienii]|uniref:hypothetical protein n=1 Tax=Xenorhabdus bovienii TaxID=40576 RepID=UPI00237CBBAD|nr:hypothetical protein [Xenorhabdus bovienii]MDE1496981.1 hypothetical protein [Xenorhabdus bovienii]MDE9446512.1 hypothetical protein [Xenorhabdus bovienii]MDE9472676.1 hypothetical protein [Xenorhabdus bovienii]MDE9544849.1 hypothetical protein [Xenorhabdus bovienii]